jgi:hypothetical protein
VIIHSSWNAGINTLPLKEVKKAEGTLGYNTLSGCYLLEGIGIWIYYPGGVNLDLVIKPVVTWNCVKIKLK